MRKMNNQISAMVLLFLYLCSSVLSCSSKKNGTGPEPERSWRTITTQHCMNAVHGTSKSDVWAVGREGLAMHYDGNDWQTYWAGTYSTLNCVASVSRNNVYAGAELGRVPHFDGNRWTVQSLGWKFIFDLCAWPSGYVVAGAAQAIFTLEDTAWVEVHNSFQDFHSIWGVSESSIYALGSDLLFHYDGHAWEEKQDLSQYSINDIWGTSASNLYGVGQRGAVYHYNGVTWESMDADSTIYSLYSIWGNSSRNIYAVGAQGILLHFDGNRWNMLESGTDLRLYGVWVSSSGDVFAVGGRGADEPGIILHYGDHEE